LRGYRRVHLTLAAIFGVLWTATFITGIFFSAMIGGSMPEDAAELARS